MKDVCHKVFFIGYGSYIRTRQKKRSLYQFHGYGNSVQYNNKSYAVSWSLHPFILYCISFLNALSGYHIIYEMSTGLFHWGQNLYQGTNLSPFCPLSGILSPVSKTGDKLPETRSGQGFMPFCPLRKTVTGDRQKSPETLDT